MQLNEAVSRRLVELMQERGMTQYQLYMKSGVPKSTIGNLVNCAYPSMKLRIIHELCQGLEIDLSSFFASPLFDENNLISERDLTAWKGAAERMLTNEIVLKVFSDYLARDDDFAAFDL